MTSEVVAALEEAWASIEDACVGLSEQEWKLPTDLPGWTVQDIVSHLIGVESLLLGDPAPTHLFARAPHIRNPAGVSNEIAVDFRRSRTGAEVLAELREITARRSRVLRSMTEADFAKPPGPPPSFTRADALIWRLGDTWIHDKDIRRALGRPTDYGGYAGDGVWAQLSLGLPRVVAKKAGVLDGTVTVLVEARPQVSILVENGRGSRLSETVPAPLVAISTDIETFFCLSLGRWSSERAIANGRVRLEGNEGLGRRILDSMNVMLDREEQVPAYGEEVAWVD